MIRVEAVQGETVPIEWFFVDLGLAEATVRSSHVRVDIRGENGVVHSLNNIDGGVLADLRKQRIKTTLATENLSPGVYSIWVDVLRNNGSRVRKSTHALAVLRG